MNRTMLHDNLMFHDEEMQDKLGWSKLGRLSTYVAPHSPMSSFLMRVVPSAADFVILRRDKSVRLTKFLASH